MTGSTLDDVPPGSRVFIDATVFVYHFCRASEQCRRFLGRCERGDVSGVTSVGVLLEVTHKLMVFEAIAAGLVSAGRAVRRLREHPEIVRQLARYSAQVAEIPAWGLEVLPVDPGGCLRAAEWRARFGLLTNDALVVATMSDAKMQSIATADQDFGRVDGLRVYRPTDLGSPHQALA